MSFIFNSVELGFCFGLNFIWESLVVKFYVVELVKWKILLD